MSATVSHARLAHSSSRWRIGRSPRNGSPLIKNTLGQSGMTAGCAQLDDLAAHTFVRQDYLKEGRPCLASGKKS